MARRIIVECDVCGTVEPDADVETYPLTMRELGSFTLDLCAEDRVKLLAPLEALAVESGVRVTGGAPSKPQRPASMMRADGHRLGRKPTGEREAECMSCDARYASHTGLRTHYTNVHGFPEGFSYSEVYGPRCPICGAADWIKGHSSRRHDVTATGAVMWARDNRDPFGVVALIRERSRNVTG